MGAKAVEPIARQAADPELLKAVKQGFAEAKVPIRGTREKMLQIALATLDDLASEGKLPADQLQAWAVALVDADLALANDPARLAAFAVKGGDRKEGHEIQGVTEARDVGAFLGAWVETARKSFGQHIYVFGTASLIGEGDRETFVVVASRKPLDLEELGARSNDAHFFTKSGQPVTPELYSPEDMKALKIRSRGIILTDDYAPVENLLAPVARTREHD